MITLRVYKERTKGFKANRDYVISLPYKTTQEGNLQHYRSLDKAAGVNTSIFQAHSVRGASSSTAANMGITTNDILKAAWSQSSKSSITKLPKAPERCSHLAQRE